MTGFEDSLIEQRTEEWFRVRCGKLTASRAKDIMSRGRRKDQEYGESYWTYFYELVGQRMTGKWDRPTWSESYAVRRGIELEDAAIHAYEFAMDVAVKKVGFIAKGNIGCSPDGLVGDDGLVEIKCPLMKQHLRNCHRGMGDYIPQGLFQLGVAEDRDWCDLVSFTDLNLGANTIKIQRVIREQRAEDIKTLMDRAADLDEMVDAFIAGETIEWE